LVRAAVGRLAGRFQDKDVLLQVDLAPRLPTLAVDAGRITQVLLRAARQAEQVVITYSLKKTGTNLLKPSHGLGGRAADHGSALSCPGLLRSRHEPHSPPSMKTGSERPFSDQHRALRPS